MEDALKYFSNLQDPRSYRNQKHPLRTLIGVQREICSLIVERNGDYVISLKGNQGSLHQDVIDYFNAQKLKEQCCSSEENDKGHGQIEQRVAYSCDAIEWLEQEHYEEECYVI